MTLALESIAWVAVLVVAAAVLVWALHVGVRPRDIVARSATALRELEPAGGRHRMHVRLVEALVVACVLAAATGAVLALAAARKPPGAPIVFGVVVLLVTLWWAGRRGVLRAAFREGDGRRPGA